MNHPLARQAGRIARFVPTGSRKVESKKAPAVVYIHERNGVCYGIAYCYSRGKPEWNYRFMNEAARTKRIAQFFAGVEAIEAYKAKKAAEKKAARAAGHTLKVGQALVASWGYDQTNVDFYEVVEVVGKNSVRIAKIASERIKNEGDRGYVIPSMEPDRIKGEPMLKRVNSDDNSVKLTSYSWARPWDGAKKYFSTYA